MRLSGRRRNGSSNGGPFEVAPYFELEGLRTSNQPITPHRQLIESSVPTAKSLLVLDRIGVSS